MVDGSSPPPISFPRQCGRRSRRLSRPRGARAGGTEPGRRDRTAAGYAGRGNNRRRRELDVPGVPSPPVQVSSPFEMVPQMGGMAGQFNPSGQPIKRPTSGPASRFEWRTPPLWGFRDSGPYLHNSRAQTLDQAVAFHGGEAAAITQKFTRLSIRETPALRDIPEVIDRPDRR